MACWHKHINYNKLLSCCSAIKYRINKYPWNSAVALTFFALSN
uniref:Uncharacterized protein n=1 Tax=Anguilla anguilla TaxID=7936 RepID=A0A0E9VEQ9_ANGAN